MHSKYIRFGFVNYLICLFNERSLYHYPCPTAASLLYLILFPKERWALFCITNYANITDTIGIKTIYNSCTQSGNILLTLTQHSEANTALHSNICCEWLCNSQARGVSLRLVNVDIECSSKNTGTDKVSVLVC